MVVKREGIYTVKLNDYQRLSRRTLPTGNRLDNLSNYALGICGESGEVADELKKVIYHGHDLDAEKIKGELGDVLHYVAGIATFLEIDLNDIAHSNINKLKERFPNGFTTEDSIRRRDING